MTTPAQNKGLSDGENLPLTEYSPPKVVPIRNSRLGTGILLTGGAILGCFALALWNRKALTELVRNRGHRKDPEQTDSATDTEAIY
jgi:hypothetical protein